MLRNIRIIFTWILFFIAYLISLPITWLDRKFRFKYSFPRDYFELKTSADWYFKTLVKEEVIPSDTKLINFKHQQINPSAIFRSEAAIVEIEYGFEGKILVHKSLVKFAPTLGSLHNRIIFNLQENHKKEYLFYKELKQNTPQLTSPQLYYAGISLSSGNICLIIEFMDNYVEYYEAEACPEDKLENVVTKMAAFHATFWGDADHKAKNVQSIPNFISDFFQSFAWGKWDKTTHEIFRKVWEQQNLPQTVIHGDLRIGNMMFSNEIKDQLVFIDWQALRKGKASFDLAYFMSVSLLTEVRQKNEVELIELYYQSLIKNGVLNYSQEDFKRDYHYSCLMVISILALPYLSGEGSVDKTNAELFFKGHSIWHQRLAAKAQELDYEYLSKQLNLPASSINKSVQSMLDLYLTQIKNMEYIPNN